MKEDVIGDSLDIRWMEYVERTKNFYVTYPALLPMRQTIFKQYMERATTLSAFARLKTYIRPLLKRQRSSGNLSKVDVVFWLDNAREVSTGAILPLHRRLTDQGVRTGLVIPSVLRSQFDNLSPMVEFRIPSSIRSSKQLRVAWAELRNILGSDLPPQTFSTFLHDALLSANAADEITRIFATHRPQLLVLSIDQFVPNSTACMIARKLGIPSLVLLHGAPSPYNAPLTADRMAVWGNISHDQMCDYGVPIDQLIVTGSPRHDSFPHPSQEASSSFRRQLGLRNLPIFVFFSNGNDLLRNSRKACEGCATWLNEAAETLADEIEFVIRLHPNEDGSLYSHYPKLHVFKNECDLNMTLIAADICGALCSTTMLDTLLYSKPVLQFYDKQWPHLADNWQRGLAERVTSAEHLIEILKTRNWPQLAASQSRFVDDIFANYPNATDTVASYILEQLKDR